VLAATLLALVAAALHAAWNLFVKTSSDRDLAAWGQFLFAGLLVVPVLAVIGLPPSSAVPYLVGSSLVHVVYVVALVQAYHHGDFSFAYPLARGGGAMVAAVGGVVLLHDVFSGWGWVAVAIVAGGLVSLIRRGTSGASIAWALTTACTIGAYTLIDSKGSRLTADNLGSVQYGFALMPFIAVTVTVANLVRGRGRVFVGVLRTAWWRFAVAGAFVTVAYTLVLVAVRLPVSPGSTEQVPVGYVTMLRESSIVMGAFAGWVFLHEKLGKHRLVSSSVVVGGLVLLILINVKS
jgi:drug/metabolite transporter (DMT)-like permease